MGDFEKLFGESSTNDTYGSRRYEFPTGNLETLFRAQAGESFEDVSRDVFVRWKPGNEYLWDEYEPESLLDTQEKQKYVVNVLLFARITVYRALRAAGQDVRGQDPFQFRADVPEVRRKLEERFPTVLRSNHDD